MGNSNEPEKKNALKRAYRPLELFLTAAVAAVFIVVMMEVVSRYIMHQSIAWGGEVCQTLIVWITFIGSAAALLTNDHMEINIVLDRIHSPAARKVIRFIRELAILVFVCVGTAGGVKLVERTWSMTTTTLQIPAGILYLAFPAGCALMIPVVLHNIYKLFTGKE